MELETINKLFLELSQFATAKTARELELERDSMDQDKANVLKLMMHDNKKGWAKISSELSCTFGDCSFDVKFDDGSKQRINFSVDDL